MKILISCDMEGTCGVVNFNQVEPPDMLPAHGIRPSPDYEWARRLLTREVNAAVEGAFAGGAEEVFVNESHDGMRNILPEELHPKARLINGSGKPLSMVQGADLGVDALILTGYHAAANTPGAVLAHTYTLSIQEVRLNGVRVGEAGLNAAIAGHFGVPVAMVAGDDKVVKEVKELLGDQVVGVAVKQGIRHGAAIQMHPMQARNLIREGAEKAVRGAKSLSPYKPASPICMDLMLLYGTQADRAEDFPGVQRTGWTSVSYTAPDMLQVAKAFLSLLPIIAIP